MKRTKSARVPSLKSAAAVLPQMTQREKPRIVLSHEPLKVVKALRRGVVAVTTRPAISHGIKRARGTLLQLEPKLGEVELLFKRAYAAFDELQVELSGSEVLSDVVVTVINDFPGEVRVRAGKDAEARAPALAPPGTSAGVTRAHARGQKALAQWVAEGVLVPSPDFATAWGVTRQALEQAVQRGALFSVKHAGRRYYPRVLLELESEPVARVCQALGSIPASDKLLFWLRGHGALRGLTPAQAVQAGRIDRVLELAAGWAAERGATRQAVGTGRTAHA